MASTRGCLLLAAGAVLLCTTRVPGQEPAPKFEVATLKVAPPPTTASFSMNLGSFRFGRLTMNMVTLNDMVMYAYGLASAEQAVGLEWNGSVRFDLQALAPPQTPLARLQLMMQQLLAERLNLVVRREERTLRHMRLVVGRDGPRMTSVSPQSTAIPGVQIRGRIDHPRMPMSMLASFLSRFERQVVLDRTGLDGLFEVKLEWAPDDALAANDAAGRPSLFAAVQEHLGLRLEGTRGPVEVLVVQEALRVPKEN